MTEGLCGHKRRIHPRIPEGQMGLALLDATLTGTKVKDLEKKLHRLFIGSRLFGHKVCQSRRRGSLGFCRMEPDGTMPPVS